MASGEPLNFTQEDVKFTGHAIECRINAEDPDRKFMPAPGKIEFLHEPSGPRVRFDSGVTAGLSIEPYYDSLIAKLIVHGRTRGDAIRIMRRALNEFMLKGEDMEVGVWQGGSIQMWKNYFGKDAKIIGVDIDPRCKQFENIGRITIEIGSQEDPNFWAAFREKYPRVDILLDDGGHTMNQQIVTFREMFPHIKDGGLYMCEDCGTSYLQNYGGGLKREGTFIEFAKNFIDEINAPFAPGSIGAIPPNYNSLNISGIHFYTYMVVVEKNKIPFTPFELIIGEPSF